MASESDSPNQAAAKRTGRRRHQRRRIAPSRRTPHPRFGYASGRMKSAFTAMVGSRALLAPFRLGPKAMWRGMLWLRSIQLLHSRSVSGDHWYLLALAVHPGHEGSGWGSQLVRYGLARAQSMRLPSYLETTNPRSIAFYQRHGFQLVGERAVAGGGPTVWGMLCSVAG